MQKGYQKASIGVETMQRGNQNRKLLVALLHCHYSYLRLWLPICIVSTLIYAFGYPFPLG
jgi:hypothetical protein